MVDACRLSTPSREQFDDRKGTLLSGAHKAHHGCCEIAAEARLAEQRAGGLGGQKTAHYGLLSGARSVWANRERVNT